MMAERTPSCRGGDWALAHRVHAHSSSSGHTSSFIPTLLPLEGSQARANIFTGHTGKPRLRGVKEDAYHRRAAKPGPERRGPAWMFYGTQLFRYRHIDRGAKGALLVLSCEGLCDQELKDDQPPPDPQAVCL